MKSIAIIGSGTMGVGIAQVAASAGCQVFLIDVRSDALEQATLALRKRFDRQLEKGAISTEQRDARIACVQTSESMDEIAQVDLAIEVVVEDMRVKHEVFRALERATAASAILATNTSSLSVAEIAACLADPSRVVGMHFFNPAPLMPLVEIVIGTNSAEAAVTSAFELAAGWGKVAVRAKDTPGFIVNRVARGYYLEALRLLGEGVGGVDEIDAVMRTHGGFRMGPFELMDLVGLDVNLAVSTSVWNRMDRHARFEPHPIQQALVEAGHLGRKTKRGFYHYEGDHALPACNVERKNFEIPPLLADAMNAFCTAAGAIEIGSTEQFIFCRILSAILNEAGHAFSQEVASSDDIDLAMIKGTNYPQGPLAWADMIGHRNVAGVLRGLDAVTNNGRYAPSQLFAKG